MHNEHIATAYRRVAEGEVVTSADLPEVSLGQARGLARMYGASLDWWTKKTGPGTARVAWRIVPRRDA